MTLRRVGWACAAVAMVAVVVLLWRLGDSQLARVSEITGVVIAVIGTGLGLRRQRADPGATAPARTVPSRPEPASEVPLDVRFVEHRHGDLVVPVYQTMDTILGTLNEVAPLAIDDCVRLYRPAAPPDWANGVQIVALGEPASARVGGLTSDRVEELMIEAGLAAEFAAYLRQRRVPEPETEFWAKVSLRRIYNDNDQIPGSVLRLAVQPQSFWIEQEINRNLVVSGSTDPVLRGLYEQGLRRVLELGRRPDGYELGIPNTLYVEVAVLTADDRLMVMAKSASAGGVYVRAGRPWTCGVERSLNWSESTPGTGSLDPAATVRAGLVSEFGIDGPDLASVEWTAIALEGHLNTALLGIARLHLSSANFADHRFPQMEHAEFVALEDVPARVFARAHDGVWHTTARMRALLTLYRQMGSETAVNRLVSAARTRPEIHRARRSALPDQARPH